VRRGNDGIFNGHTGEHRSRRREHVEGQERVWRAANLSGRERRRPKVQQFQRRLRMGTTHELRRWRQCLVRVAAASDVGVDLQALSMLRVVFSRMSTAEEQHIIGHAHLGPEPFHIRERCTTL